MGQSGKLKIWGKLEDEKGEETGTNTEKNNQAV